MVSAVWEAQEWSGAISQAQALSWPLQTSAARQTMAIIWRRRFFTLGRLLPILGLVVNVYLLTGLPVNGG